MTLAQPLLTPAIRPPSAPASHPAYGGRALVHSAPSSRLYLLRNRRLVMEVAAGRAGGIVSLDWRDGKTRLPILRASSRHDAGLACGELGCRPLVKTASRSNAEPPVYSARLRFDPIGTAQSWRVDKIARDALTLVLDADDFHPFCLTQTMVLSDSTLRLMLTLRNDSAYPQHLGLGLACSIVREAQTWLAAAADGIACPGRDGAVVPHWVPTPPAWSLGVGYPLSSMTHEHAFSSWSGIARIHWPARGVGLALQGDATGYVLALREGDDCFGFYPIDCGPSVQTARPRRAHRDAGTQCVMPGAVLSRVFELKVERGGWGRCGV